MLGTRNALRNTDKKFGGLLRLAHEAPEGRNQCPQLVKALKGRAGIRFAVRGFGPVAS